MGASISSLSSLRQSLIRARDAGNNVAHEITEQTTLAMFKGSQDIVPVATGKLRSTATAVVENLGNVTEGTITYGDNQGVVDYAIYVHEIPPVEYVSSYSGKQLPGHKHQLPRMYKFLEIPFDEDVNSKFDERSQGIVNDAMVKAFE